MSKQRRLARLTAVGAVGALTLFGGLAAAGALPGAADGVADSVLEGLGISGSGTPDGHADTRGESDSHPAVDDTEGEDEATATDIESSSRSEGLSDALGNVTANGASDTAADVLSTLNDPELTPGPGLGAEVSDVASGGTAHVPTSLPPAAQDVPAESHVPSSVPAGRP